MNVERGYGGGGGARRWERFRILTRQENYEKVWRIGGSGKWSRFGSGPVSEGRRCSQDKM